MWPFDQRVSRREFLRFQKRVQESFQEARRDVQRLSARCDALESDLRTFTALSERFSELHKRFTELTEQFTELQNRYRSVGAMSSVPEVQPPPEQTPHHRTTLTQLTALERKGFLYIGKLQNDAGGEWIPIRSLAAHLYPDRSSRRVQTTISNVLKKLLDAGLVARERQQNFWFVRLTDDGFRLLRQELHAKQLQGLLRVYGK